MSATPANATRIALLVLYTDHLEESRAFYTGLGLAFVREQHGRGPVHYTATLPGGTVIELYPATARRPVSSVRLGFTVDSRTVTPPLAPGRHVVEDPDGRAVELYVA
ncbi:VOC family protein [Streptomyces sp. NPDC005962]|uniref:VOC family protein n=1 Tax=Streptomyces sp. NPDC005962 TaxID=3154466 RepID=UPI0033C9F221